MALGSGRPTIQMEASPIFPSEFSIPVADDVHIFEGAIVVLDANGRAKPGVTGVDLLALGCATRDADNTVVGHTAGGISALIRIGAFWYKNSAAGDAIAASDLFTLCYIVDDQTVAKTDGGNTRSRAGMIVGVDSVKGVAVLFVPMALALL